MATSRFKLSLPGGFLEFWSPVIGFVHLEEHKEPNQGDDVGDVSNGAEWTDEPFLDLIADEKCNDWKSGNRGAKPSFDEQRRFGGHWLLGNGDNKPHEQGERNHSN